MLDKKLFFKVVESMKTFDSAIERLSEAITGNKYYSNLCLWETDWGTATGTMFDVFIDSHFTKNGADLIYWWLYENVPKVIYENQKDLFTNKKEIQVETLDELWNYMIKNKEEYFLG